MVHGAVKYLIENINSVNSSELLSVLATLKFSRSLLFQADKMINNVYQGCNAYKTKIIELQNGKISN